MKIVYFGTSSFSAKVLEYLVDNGIDVAAVVTRVDKPKGRSTIPTPPPVKECIAKKAPGIPILQPTKLSDPAFVELLRSYDADMFVCAAYGRIIPDAVLALPRYEAVNLHTSLLPKYRGAAPIQRAVMAGERMSGVTIMKMVKELDAGDIISVVETPVDDNMTFGDLEERLCVIGREALLNSLNAIYAGTATMTPQDHSKATYAEKVEIEECEISWDNDAHTIHNTIRGVTPHPGAWCIVSARGKEKRLKICSTHVHDEKNHDAEPGTILSADMHGIVIACRKGSVAITSLQLEGKKAMTAKEFLNGFPAETLHFPPKK